MNRKFGGFTESQIGAIAQKMGYKGPVSNFNSFLADPNNAAKFSRYVEKAKSFVENPPQKMATGGSVKSTTASGNFQPATGKATLQSPATAIGMEAVKNPQNVATLADTATMTPNHKEMIGPKSGQVQAVAVAKQHTPLKANTASDVSTPDTATMDPTMSNPAVEDVANNMNTVQGTVSQNSQVEAATAMPSADATVQGQLEKLMTQFEGTTPPPWAAGAMRMANSVMNQRGLGASSMAGSAITQAAMESAISIASQDAATFGQFEMANLNNRQQARLQNAQAFLQMDMANLEIASQTEMFKSQARIQSIFTDQAADNAAQQFNASSQNQTEQFFAQLKTQVSQFNASQINAMKQFDAEKQTAIKMFNAEQENARQQFNANSRLIIDQANAKWRQQITTENNAQANENNRLNAQLATGMTTQAYNNLWQKERDLMAYAFTASENDEQRAHEVVLQKSGDKGAQQVALGAAAGKLVASIFDGLF